MTNVTNDKNNQAQKSGNTDLVKYEDTMMLPTPTAFREKLLKHEMTVEELKEGISFFMSAFTNVYRWKLGGMILEYERVFRKNYAMAIIDGDIKKSDVTKLFIAEIKKEFGIGKTSYYDFTNFYSKVSPSKLEQFINLSWKDILSTKFDDTKILEVTSKKSVEELEADNLKKYMLDNGTIDYSKLEDDKKEAQKTKALANRNKKTEGYKKKDIEFMSENLKEVELMSSRVTPTEDVHKNKQLKTNMYNYIAKIMINQNLNTTELNKVIKAINDTNKTK